jgi:hypothetical protein
VPASTLRPPKNGRTHLSADPPYKLLHGSFQRVTDHRRGTPAISLPDALMSGVALFALPTRTELRLMPPAPREAASETGQI